jgi:hypothetical protein
MKTIALTLIAAALGFAQTTDSKATSDKTSAPAKKSQSTAPQAKSSAAQKPAPSQKANAPVLTVPEGAKLVEPNTYRFTDSGGKTWMYRQTPFGISRWEDTPAAATPQPAPQSQPTTVTDLGDSVRFERKTAFGVSQWVRKKTELTDEEKALLEKESNQPKTAEQK